MTHYDTLQVSPQASPEVIRAAYKSLMQRYHPDKNHHDPEPALQAATRIAQAYAILSDTDKRASYDTQLSASQGSSRASAAPARSARAVPQPARQAAASTALSWWLGLIVAVIALSAWAMLALSKSSGSAAAELKKIRLAFESQQLTEEQRRSAALRRIEILEKNPSLKAQESAEYGQELARRTVVLWDAPVMVRLQAVSTTVQSGVASTQIILLNLTIPALKVRVGTFDAEQAMRLVEKQKDLLVHNLAVQLQQIKPQDLNDKNAEQTLKNTILSSIATDLAMNRSEVYPSTLWESPGRYGVVEAVLPESFSLRPANPAEPAFR